MPIQPYLYFNGRCEEAAEFYRDALGAEVLMMMRVKDSPEPANAGLPPGSEDKILHMSLRIGDGELMASDGFCSGQTDFKGFALSVTATSDAEAEKTFNALAVGGQVQMPLSKTFFAARFGMVTDRFGVAWTVMLP